MIKRDGTRFTFLVQPVQVVKCFVDTLFVSARFLFIDGGRYSWIVVLLGFWHFDGSLEG